MPTLLGSSVPAVVAQHVEELTHLRGTRTTLVRAPHVRLLHLSRLDERIAAHLDGLSMAGAVGRELCLAALAQPGVGELFVVTSYALATSDTPLLKRLLAVVEALPEVEAGLLSAFGWTSASKLRSVTRALLASSSAFERHIGLGACALHRVDPGSSLGDAIGDSSPRLRARALKTVGQCARRDLLPQCLLALQDADDECRHHAAVAALLLGDRGRSLDVVRAEVQSPAPEHVAAFLLSLGALSSSASRGVLKSLGGPGVMHRVLIRGMGMTGDVQYVPWLIAQMRDPQWARVAGESFQLITGLDLIEMGFEAERPHDYNDVPNVDPEDERVNVDEDEDLPWPDHDGIHGWWGDHGSQFVSGTRYFLGARVSRAHCVDTLKRGHQRQRIMAAHHLCLLEPGTPLFNTSAPTWRQRRGLATMS